MPNVLGTLTPALVVQRALELVFTKRPILNAITFGVADPITGSTEALFNQTVYSRIKNIPAVNNFGTGAVDTAYTDVPVVLDQFKEVHLAFTPQEYNSTTRDLLDEVATPVAVAIANHLVDAIAARWIAANFTNSTIVASGWTYTNTLVVLRNALALRGVPDFEPWFFACNSTVYGTLLTDSLVVSALNNPANGEAIKNGRLPQAAGLVPMEYPALPSTGNMVGFAGAKQSTIIAARTPTDPQTVMPGVTYPGTFEVISEPKSGLSVVLNKFIGQSDLKANYRVLLMYGTAKGDGAMGQILKTA
jgi:hypothetical protein